ncbi:hypothetical protein ES288_D13G199400v1 [Gossypium darwinii]|uniref:Uncharacterized protein n=1 Tax=Gossypium darwinii TaxID=34276 RepID=A0A5D2A2I9_GOSDA|nr:hypothetical protein ES288_D13G199400v1 [Gossypium darwinii]
MLYLFVFSLYFDHLPTDRLQMGEVVSTIPTSKRHFFELFFCSKQWPQKLLLLSFCHHFFSFSWSLILPFVAFTMEMEKRLLFSLLVF